MLFTLGITASRIGIYSAALVLFLLSCWAAEIRQAASGLPHRASTAIALKYRVVVILLLFSIGLAINVGGGLNASSLLVTTLSALPIAAGILWCYLTAGKQRATLHRQSGNFIVALCCCGLAAWLSSRIGSQPSPGKATRAITDLLHTSSDIERLSLLRGTLYLILQHPWAGSGLGSFETAFAGVRNLPGMHISAGTVTHPHNELLYVWAEGGLVALAGLLLAGAACLLPALHAQRSGPGAATLSRRRGTQLFSATSALLILPIMLHLMLEYPLYQSAPHLLVLLLLARLGLPENAGHTRRRSPCAPPDATPLRGALYAGCAVLFALAIALARGLVIQNQLTWSERHGLNQFPAGLSLADQLTQYERYDFDSHTRLLLDYNRSRDPALLNRYFAWGQRYLRVHNDREVYDSMIRIAQFERKTAAATALTDRAHQDFPRDARFQNSGR